MDKVNPYITMDNPYDAQNKKAEDYAKEHPEIFEMSRLCYEVFHCNEFGTKLIKLLEDRFLYSQMVNPTSDNAAETALYWTGFSDCIKGLVSQGNEHKKRIAECQMG